VRASVNNPHWPNEAIALADYRLHKTWLCRLVAQCGSDFPDDVVDVAIRIDEEVRSPKPRDNVGTRNQLSAPLNQKDEEIHRFSLDLHTPTGPAKFVPP
jgi:hypothetical protein